MKIAIMTRNERLEDKNRIFVNETYLQMILSYHHTPIPIYEMDVKETLASFCDALLLPGGYDIASFYFHEPLHKTTHLYEDATVDEREFKILEAFVKKQKPILGICRGMQIINVFFHGSLHQDIVLSTHESQPHQHLLHPQRNTFLEGCMPLSAKVNSYHHQAVNKVGKHMLICGRAEDGIIEAIRHESLPIIAVQWHPELMKHDLIFPYFFQLAQNILF